MSYADTAPRAPNLGFKVEVKVRREPPTPPDPEDRRPWWRRAWDAVQNFVKIETK